MLGKNIRLDSGRDEIVEQPRPSAPADLPEDRQPEPQPVPQPDNPPDGPLGAVGAHIETYIGHSNQVFHELVPEKVHIDVHVVNPSPEHPFYTLVTSGMSNRPMPTPLGLEDYQYSEVVICLPPEWEFGLGAFRSEENYWPVRWLKILARFPHIAHYWLWAGHTVPNGNPPEPYAANTRLCCALLSRPTLFGEGFLEMPHPTGRRVHFHSFIPLYKEEMALKLEDGYGELALRLADAGVTELVDVHRPSVVPRRWWFLRH